MIANLGSGRAPVDCTPRFAAIERRLIGTGGDETSWPALGTATREVGGRPKEAVARFRAESNPLAGAAVSVAR